MGEALSQKMAQQHEDALKHVAEIESALKETFAEQHNLVKARVDEQAAQTATTLSSMAAEMQTLEERMSGWQNNLQSLEEQVSSKVEDAQVQLEASVAEQIG